MALPHAFDHRDPQMGVPVAAWRRNACQGGIGALLRRFAFRRDAVATDASDRGSQSHCKEGRRDILSGYVCNRA